MTDRGRLEQLLRGEPKGYTRTELSYRLNLPDRAVRKLIEDCVAESDWPIYADRDSGGEARYRILRAHEIDLCNRANAEDRARAMSLFAKAKGRREAFARRYQTGALFLDAVGELEDVA